ncbi:hypothetical protein ABN222_07270 [Providencia alcalifaciens]
MREVKPTQKPVPSSDIKDLFFNSGLLDIWATSLERKYIDRFGNCHLTAAGMEWLFKELVEKFNVDMNTAIIAAGYITIDSFQQGADLPNNELTKRNQILRDEITGEYYRWDGDLPKQVLAGSTPQSTGGIGNGAWISVGDASLRSEINVVVKKFNSVSDAVGDIGLKVGGKISVENYYENGNSGELFFTVVPAGTGIEDGGKFINLQNGFQIMQNIKIPCDPRAWGAVGDGNLVNAAKDTKGVQGAVNYGATYINDGSYYINKTTKIKTNKGVNSSRGAVLHYINEVGECMYINDGNNEIGDAEFRVRIVDGGKDRKNTWSVVCEKVPRSVLAFEISPSEDYLNIYGDLSEEERLDLKFGMHIFNNSYTNSIESHLYQSSLLLESPDNSIVEPCVIWSNNRRHSVILNAASNLFQGVQMVPGKDAGIYSEANDITNIQVIGCYFDGNRRLQSVIPTGDCIKLKGNLRRSTILGNRFFIPAKASIAIDGQLQGSSIGNNFFENGDSADTGIGDIVIGSSTASTISSNNFFRSNLAEKTGAARTKPVQPPITIKTANEYDEPTYISLNSIQGNNYYANSSYPVESAIFTSKNHIKIHNQNKIKSRYDDKGDIKCYKAVLTLEQIKNLPTSEVYVSDLSVIGLSGAGYIKTLLVQDYTTGSATDYGKQEITMQANGDIYIRMKDAGVWGAFRKI